MRTTGRRIKSVSTKPVLVREIAMLIVRFPTGIDLAKLHSKAVDYVKTGLPAEWKTSLEPRKWPHFMEKGRHRSYHSTTALGQLYDMAKQPAFNLNEEYKLPFDSRILNAFKLSNDLLKTARRIKTQYDIAVRRALGQMGINTEFELF